MADHTAQKPLPPAPVADRNHAPASERRHGERFRARLQVLVKCAAEGDFVQMRSHDLSSGGMFVAAQDPPLLGTLVRLQGADSVGIEGVGRVVWVRSSDQSLQAEPPGMGIKFIKLSAQSKEGIEQLANSPPDERTEEETNFVVAPPPELTAPSQEPDSGVWRVPPSLPPPSVAVLMRAAIPCGEPGYEPPQEMPSALLDAQASPAPSVDGDAEDPVRASPPDDGYGPSDASPQAQAAWGPVMVLTPARPPQATEVSTEAQASAVPHGRVIERAHTTRPTTRHGAMAIAGACMLGALGWATWPKSSPKPLVRVTHAATAALPSETPAQPSPTAAPAPPSAVAVSAVTQPEVRQPVPLPHVLHVETDPSGAWLMVGAQRGRTPADIVLSDFDGKRVGLTVGRNRYESKLVYVQADQFIERGDAMRANVKLKLEFRPKGDLGTESPAQEAEPGAAEDAAEQPTAPASEKSEPAAEAAPRADKTAPSE